MVLTAEASPWAPERTPKAEREVITTGIVCISTRPRLSTKTNSVQSSKKTKKAAISTPPSTVGSVTHYGTFNLGIPPTLPAPPFQGGLPPLNGLSTQIPRRPLVPP